jgi:hypothetical protein
MDEPSSSEEITTSDTLFLQKLFDNFQNLLDKIKNGTINKNICFEIFNIIKDNKNYTQCQSCIMFDLKHIPYSDLLKIEMIIERNII